MFHRGEGGHQVGDHCHCPCRTQEPGAGWWWGTWGQAVRLWVRFEGGESNQGGLPGWWPEALGRRACPLSKQGRASTEQVGAWLGLVKLETPVGHPSVKANLFPPSPAPPAHPPPSHSLCQRVNLELQFIKFLVILPFTFQLSLHLERGTHHAY